jgi:hypothetical protein
MHASHSEYRARLLQYTPVYYTVLKVRSNHGVPLVWLGIVCMTAGVILVFSVSRKNLWMCVLPQGDRLCTVVVAGNSNQTESVFGAEFCQICDGIRDSVGGNTEVVDAVDNPDKEHSA